MNTTATINPVEIDTRIAEINVTLHNAYQRIDNVILSARYLLPLPSKALDSDVLDALVKAVAEGTIPTPIDRESAERGLETIAKANDTIREALAQRAPLDALYDAHCWTRFSQVVGGHIHRGDFCAGGTIRSTTLVGWRVDLSGTTIEKAVAELGPTLCSHCFPEAPIEWRRSVAEVKAEAEADVYCTSKDLTPAERASVNWGRMYKWVQRCESCGAQDVTLTATGLKRKHKRPGK